MHRHLLLVTFIATVTCARAQEPRAVLSPLDPRAIYGKSTFPEPLRAPEMDVEAELRFDWFHAEKYAARQDTVKAEFEYSFGYLTLEVGTSYNRAETAARDPITGLKSLDRAEGIGGIELAARYPLYQFVTHDAAFEYTLVGALELAVPSGSKISKDTELVPQLFQLMRFGDHVTLQTSVGLSSLFGPDQGGSNTLEYAAVLGYAIERDRLRLPGVQRIIPLAELIGEHGFNGENRGKNLLSATFGARILFHSLGNLQPRLGIGYVAPLNRDAREEFRWGVVTSLAFEF